MNTQCRSEMTEANDNCLSVWGTCAINPHLFQQVYDCELVMSTPLHTVKSDFGSKEALVEKLVPLLDRQDNESDGEFKERLMRVSNRKLLRLWEREQTLRETFTNREQLVDQIVEAKLGRGDTEMRNRLLGLSTGRLLSMRTGQLRKG